MGGSVLYLSIFSVVIVWTVRHKCAAYSKISLMSHLQIFRMVFELALHTDLHSFSLNVGFFRYLFENCPKFLEKMISVSSVGPRYIAWVICSIIQPLVLIVNGKIVWPFDLLRIRPDRSIHQFGFPFVNQNMVLYRFIVSLLDQA